ncbi:MAG: nucleotidyltransferase domain-containing protein [Dehalococcoidales bacterium]|nr:nucleotidyltransferase domain-containing protein [Dehalococcoidales bacterium]
MINIMSFVPGLILQLPATHALLKSANLVVHQGVSRIVLHGSRGTAGGFRPDSDIDLSLLVEPLDPFRPDLAAYLDNIAEITFSQWQSPVEPDMAVVFDIRDCRLRCFDRTSWAEKENICTEDGKDCFGLYKNRKGFNGLVINAGVQVRLMYPCLNIWQRPG